MENRNHATPPSTLIGISDENELCYYSSFEGLPYQSLSFITTNRKVERALVELGRHPVMLIHSYNDNIDFPLNVLKIVILDHGLLSTSLLLNFFKKIITVPIIVIKKVTIIQLEFISNWVQTMLFFQHLTRLAI
jgi:hypothetical protein